MKSRRRLLPTVLFTGLAGITVVATVILLRHPTGTGNVTWEAVQVHRLDAVDLLRETGTLAPRVPLVVPCPFDGRLQWVIEDATWVEPGATVAIISDDDERRRIAEDRAQLGEAQQDLQLAKLRRAQADSTEAAKVAAATRDLDLEQIRYRILTSPAQGGMALVAAAKELEPLLSAVAEARTAAEASRLEWQGKENAWLEAVSRQQTAQDEVDRLEGVIQDLVEAVADSGRKNAGVADLANERRKQRRQEQALAQVVDQGDAADPAKNGAKTVDPANESESPTSDPKAALAIAREQLTAARTVVTTSTGEVVAANQARDAAAKPRDAARQVLDAAETAAREPRIRLEIERRVLPATELALDVQVATANLAEADRRLTDGKAANAAGVASAAELADLTSIQANAAAALEVVKARYEQAALPPTKEALAEAEARLAKAKASAAAAEGVRQRNLALADAQVAVGQAKVARYEASLAARTRRFPSTIEQEISALQREREVNPEDAPRLDAAIAIARKDLATATASPPNVITAPVAGLARVRREGNRQKLAGDQVWQSDPIVEVHPPANLEILVRVNEVNVNRVAPGQTVAVAVPALPGIQRTGKILTVSGAGRDKGDQAGMAQRWTGVTQFDVRVALDPGPGDADLRQGMTALVEIATERKANALVLPRGAGLPGPTGAKESWTAILAPETKPVPLNATSFGDDLLLVPDLAEGSTVYIKRVGHE